MFLAHQIILWVSMVFLAMIAWHDFKTFKIRNRDVLILCVMVVLILALRGFQGATADILAGVLLFLLGFTLWLLGAMGAGDVKLYLPLGVLVGWQNLPVYVVFLLIASILMLVVIGFGRWYPTDRGAIRARLTEIAATKGVPYAVPMAVAALLTLLPQAIQM